MDGDGGGPGVVEGVVVGGAHEAAEGIVEELVVDSVAAGGDGIAREPSGRVVFVRGGLPGETVRARVVSEARDYAKATVQEVLAAHPGRVAPPCPLVAAGCGGCAWQHADAETQLDLKVAIVRDALARQGRLPEAIVSAGGAVPAFGYRTTLRLAVLPSGAVGWRAAGSHEVVAAGACPVAHPLLAELLPGLRVHGADEVQLRVGVASGERSVSPIVERAPAGGAQAGRAQAGKALAGQARAGQAHAGRARSGRGRVEITGLPPDVVVGEHSVVHEDVAGHRFRVSARSFFQSSPQAAELLVSTVRAEVADADVRRVVDLYAGVGLFAATVAPHADVVCVEQSASACRDAEHNLSGRSATVVETDVGSWNPRRAGTSAGALGAGPFTADLIVADPARRGLEHAGVATIGAVAAPLLVLVSCDAAALGRDTKLLTDAGWRHDGSTVLDVFPQTPHVEVVTRFVRS